MTTEVEMTMNIVAKVTHAKDSNMITINAKTKSGISKEDSDKLIALVGAEEGCSIMISTQISMICAAIRDLVHKTKQPPNVILGAVIDEISGNTAHA